MNIRETESVKEQLVDWRREFHQTPVYLGR